jgi:hypothetical protein
LRDVNGKQRAVQGRWLFWQGILILNEIPGDKVEASLKELLAFLRA